MTKDFNPHFDVDFARGLLGENLVADLAGMTVEVKTDYLAWKTGNFYIETWQYRADDASDKRMSGINVTTADYWCFAGPAGRGLIFIKTEDLKQIIRDTDPLKVHQRVANDYSNASIGRLVPVRDVLNKIVSL
jgi:hypothetical protein